jgi:hypothetical protein
MRQEYVRKIADFIQEHIRLYDRDQLEEFIQTHESYGTLDFAINTSNSIVAVVRFNVSDDGKCAHVLDFCIRKEHRNNGVINDFLERALIRFPKLLEIEFQRGIRGCERSRRLNIQRILRRSNNYVRAIS